MTLNIVLKQQFWVDSVATL